LHDVGLTIYGVTALTFMMAMYALERRHRAFVLAFAIGCMLASSYGFLSGAWPFGAVEAIWSLVALRRYVVAVREARPGAGQRARGGRAGEQGAG